MLELKIPYPETLPDALRQTRSQFEQEAKTALAVKLFELGRVPSGIAASIAGMDRVTFLMTLHTYGVAMVDIDDEALLEDVKNA